MRRLSMSMRRRRCRARRAQWHRSHGLRALEVGFLQHQVEHCGGRLRYRSARTRSTMPPHKACAPWLDGSPALSSRSQPTAVAAQHQGPLRLRIDLPVRRRRAASVNSTPPSRLRRVAGRRRCHIDLHPRRSRTAEAIAETKHGREVLHADRPTPSHADAHAQQRRGQRLHRERRSAGCPLCPCRPTTMPIADELVVAYALDGRDVFDPRLASR